MSRHDLPSSVEFYIHNNTIFVTQASQSDKATTESKTAQFDIQHDALDCPYFEKNTKRFYIDVSRAIKPPIITSTTLTETRAKMPDTIWLNENIYDYSIYPGVKNVFNITVTRKVDKKSSVYPLYAVGESMNTFYFEIVNASDNSKKTKVVVEFFV